MTKPGTQASNQKLLASLSFRPGRITECEEISRLVNSAYRGDSSRLGWTTEADLLDGQRTDPEAIRSTMSQTNNWILVCELKGKIIGSVHLEKREPDTCYFGMFTVTPELQNEGIGKVFIAECERFAWQELKCRWLEMTVITLRKELISWYERRGYQFTGEHRKFPYHDERFGIPLREDIVLGVWKKQLSQNE